MSTTLSTTLRLAAGFTTTLVVMVLLDMIWLGLVAKSTYQQGIGHLMAERPIIPVAVLFYLIYAVGLTIFTLRPFAGQPGLGQTVIAAALFGFFAYATYDLTNLATLKDWPVRIVLIDIAWGTFVSAVSATAGKWMLDRLAAG
ncbi:DUF2177 family protein [Methyloversatilis sp.]|uniref:DUF2177 family protein n=1 Tax=Methyloversatilis sp. TaxID=2569862 RepID=UPI00273262D3|nr:DUF2177 family protein [Methyloversatilis sp.]MDP2867444.1 DUF2177 family protein [Methyloversatilis sp.]MDP3455041.1 DUF2177 family protein [Methyloversatilis sp.]MDP3578786.1 DUF2177 family protein [Methyloversatilis sp.]